MKNSKNTKRALLASVLSVVLCAAMLIGTTFAWFTDSVTSGNNIIQSGNLDVEMYWAEGTNDPAAETEWKDASEDAIFDYDLWEPGYTEVRHIKISNVGSLALKYKIKIVPTGEVGTLADVIDVYYIKGGQQITDRTDLNDANKIGTLSEVLKNPAAANGHISGKKDDVVSSDIATIALKMQETAGNDYMNKSIGSDFAIQLSATQYTEENDSFDNQYDKGAWSDLDKQDHLDDLIAEGYVQADSNDSFAEAIKSSDKVVVTGNLVVDQGTQVVVDRSAIVDFNYGKVTRETKDHNGLKITNYDADVTLQNADFVSTKGGVVIRVEGAKSLTVKNSNFICEAPGSTGNKIFHLTPSEADKKMTVTFENCVFDTGYVGIEGYSNITEYDVRFVNCKFVWDDKNGSSFVQAGSYAKGNYSFENCTFEYTNWWSGDLIQINNPKEKSAVTLQDITVIGSGDKKPYVASGFSVGGKRNLTVTSKGTNSYTFNSETIDWDTISVNK